jgi:replicative DNA helicase
MLISPTETIAKVVAQANEEYLYVPAHQLIYGELVKLWDSGEGVI